MTQSPSSEAKWTQSLSHDTVIFCGDQMLGCLVGNGYAARAVQSVNACQSIPGDPEIALAKAIDALKQAEEDSRWRAENGSDDSRISKAHERAADMYAEALKSLGYDGDSK